MTNQIIYRDGLTLAQRQALTIAANETVLARGTDGNLYEITAGTVATGGAVVGSTGAAGITVQDGGVQEGTSIGTVNFGSNLDVTVAGGVATIDGTASGTVVTHGGDVNNPVTNIAGGIYDGTSDTVTIQDPPSLSGVVERQLDAFPKQAEYDYTNSNLDPVTGSTEDFLNSLGLSIVFANAPTITEDTTYYLYNTTPSPLTNVTAEPDVILTFPRFGYTSNLSGNQRSYVFNIDKGREIVNAFATVDVPNVDLSSTQTVGTTTYNGNNLFGTFYTRTVSDTGTEVLTYDRATQAITWELPSAPTGGLMAVSSDSTLSGDGTSSAPLGVSNNGIGRDQLDFEAGTDESNGRVISLSATNELGTSVLPNAPAINFNGGTPTLESGVTPTELRNLLEISDGGGVTTAATLPTTTGTIGELISTTGVTDETATVPTPESTVWTLPLSDLNPRIATGSTFVGFFVRLPTGTTGTFIDDTADTDNLTFTAGDVAEFASQYQAHIIGIPAFASLFAGANPVYTVAVTFDTNNLYVTLTATSNDNLTPNPSNRDDGLNGGGILLSGNSGLYNGLSNAPVTTDPGSTTATVNSFAAGLYRRIANNSALGDWTPVGANTFQHFDISQQVTWAETVPPQVFTGASTSVSGNNGLITFGNDADAAQFFNDLRPRQTNGTFATTSGVGVLQGTTPLALIPVGTTISIATNVVTLINLPIITSSGDTPLTVLTGETLTGRIGLFMPLPVSNFSVISGNSLRITVPDTTDAAVITRLNQIGAARVNSRIVLAHDQDEEHAFYIISSFTMGVPGTEDLVIDLTPVTSYSDDGTAGFEGRTPAFSFTLPTSGTVDLFAVGNIQPNDNSFISLVDTPSTFNGAAGQFLRVNSTGTGLEFIAQEEDPIATITAVAAPGNTASWTPLRIYDETLFNGITGLTPTQTVNFAGATPFEAGSGQLIRTSGSGVVPREMSSFLAQAINASSITIVQDDYYVLTFPSASTSGFNNQVAIFRASQDTSLPTGTGVNAQRFENDELGTAVATADGLGPTPIPFTIRRYARADMEAQLINFNSNALDLGILSGSQTIRLSTDPLFPFMDSTPTINARILGGSRIFARIAAANGMAADDTYLEILNATATEIVVNKGAKFTVNGNDRTQDSTDTRRIAFNVTSIDDPVFRALYEHRVVQVPDPAIVDLNGAPVLATGITQTEVRDLLGVSPGTTLPFSVTTTEATSSGTAYASPADANDHNIQYQPSIETLFLATSSATDITPGTVIALVRNTVIYTFIVHSGQDFSGFREYRASPANSTVASTLASLPAGNGVTLEGSNRVFDTSWTAHPSSSEHLFSFEADDGDGEFAIPMYSGASLPNIAGNVGEIFVLLSADGSNVPGIYRRNNATVLTDAAWTRVATNQSTGGGGATTLNGLTDVNIFTPGDGNVLTYNASQSQWFNRTPASLVGDTILGNHSDVTITSVADNNTLQFDSTSTDWVNRPLIGTAGSSTPGSQTSYRWTFTATSNSVFWGYNFALSDSSDNAVAISRMGSSFVNAGTSNQLTPLVSQINADIAASSANGVWIAEATNATTLTIRTVADGSFTQRTQPNATVSGGSTVARSGLVSFNNNASVQGPTFTAGADPVTNPAVTGFLGTPTTPADQFLRGDGVWASPPTSGPGGGTTVAVWQVTNNANQDVVIAGLDQMTTLVFNTASPTLFGTNFVTGTNVLAAGTYKFELSFALGLTGATSGANRLYARASTTVGTTTYNTGYNYARVRTPYAGTQITDSFLHTVPSGTQTFSILVRVLADSAAGSGTIRMSPGDARLMITRLS